MFLRVFCACCALCLGLQLVTGADSIRINEVMAINTRTLADEEGDYPDWIELHNAGTTSVNLHGWSVTDQSHSRSDQGWTFPSTNIEAGAYLVIFASGKNRARPGEPLHTDFKLSREGEPLLLFSPQGVLEDDRLSLGFSPQLSDISFGLGKQSVDRVLIETNTPCRWLIPEDLSLADLWYTEEFSNLEWPVGLPGIGYDARTQGPLTFHSLIHTDLRSRMLGRNASLYLRVPFLLDSASEIDGLTLEMMFSDGFVAFLNGVEAAGMNNPPELSWNSTALNSRDPLVELRPSQFNIGRDAFRSLHPGTNWLAIQGFNSSRTNGQFLIIPRLIAATATSQDDSLRYFTLASPGGPNGLGTRELGPVIEEVSPPPRGLPPGLPLPISIRVTATFANISSVELRYRVMYGPEFTLSMEDNGRIGDSLAKDGIYGAIIPADVAGAGEILRWYWVAHDVEGHSTRYPAFENPSRSPEYLGTMAETNIGSRMPVFHWFVAPSLTNAANTLSGTRCSLFYDGELYDNVGVRIRGSASLGYWKKSYKFDFNPRYFFRYDQKEARVEEVNLNSTWSDKSYIRQVLSWETFKNASAPYCNSFLVHLEQNNHFHSLAIFVEQPDARMLKRNRLDPRGALYKVNNDLSSILGVEKQQPADGDFSELRGFLDGIASSNPNRARFLWDNLNLPSIVNYLAVNTLLHDNDCAAKNYFLYRDSFGTREWFLLPWDKDLTFGRNFQGVDPDLLWASADTAAQAISHVRESSPSHPFFMDRSHQKYDGRWNRLVDLFYQVPEFRAMYVRRLRTLMDALLQPPETPPDQLRFERRLDELLHLAQLETQHDRSLWGRYDYGVDQDMGTAVKALQSQYLAPRRVHLFVTHNETNATKKIDSGRVPQAAQPGLNLAFGQVERVSATGNPGEEYIELFNPNTVAVDISGWQLHGMVQHVFLPGTVIPPGLTLYLTPDVRAFRARATRPTGGLGLFVQGNYHGALSARAGRMELWDGSRLAASTALTDEQTLAQANLRVVRIMYHPKNVPGNEPDDLEYLELRNSGSSPVNLMGVRFMEGVHFDFSLGSVTNLPAPPDFESVDRSVLIVKNRAAWERHYGVDSRIAGEYSGSLDNQGERLTLADVNGETILSFQYRPAWQPLSDGLGFALIHNGNGDPEEWTNSDLWQLGPYEDVPGPLASPKPHKELPTVRINEIVANPKIGEMQAIEIQAESGVDLEGWFMTDNFLQPLKYRIPAPAFVQKNGIRVFTEAEFGQPNGRYPGFNLNGLGGEVYLFSATPDGRLTGHVDGVKFSAPPEGVSLGRFFDSHGNEHWGPLKTTTLGSTNSLWRVGSVLISELLYQSPEFVEEMDRTAYPFIELHNPGADSVFAFDPLAPTNTWRIGGGVEFVFPTQTVIPPGGYLIVVGFDPQTEVNQMQRFRKRYLVPGDVRILGPWAGSLPTRGGRISLEAPIRTANGIGKYLLDEITYGPEMPGLELAAGQGPSLSRRDEYETGLDPSHWFLSAPNPGRNSENSVVPSILIQPRSGSYPGYVDLLLNVLAGPDQDLTYQWRYDGNPIAAATTSTLRVPLAEPKSSGKYDVLVMSRKGVAVSSNANVMLIQPPMIYNHPAGSTVAYTSNFVMRVTAFGMPPLRYQWKFNGIVLPNETEPALRLVGVDPSMEGFYTVVVTDANLSVESRPATIALMYRPTILSAPESRMVNVGENVLLSVTVSGTGPFAYFWRKDGVSIRAPSLPNLSIPRAQLTNAGSYSVGVSNRATPRDRVYSAAANLLVLNDSDGDGMPDLWELTHQLRFDEAKDADIDSDFDGLTNLEEYEAGTNPNDPFDFLKIKTIERLTNEVDKASLTFMAVSNRSYTLQIADRPGSPWSNWLSFPALTTNRPAQVTIDLNSGISQRNFRLLTPKSP